MADEVEFPEHYQDGIDSLEIDLQTIKQQERESGMTPETVKQRVTIEKDLQSLKTRQRSERCARESYVRNFLRQRIGTQRDAVTSWENSRIRFMEESANFSLDVARSDPAYRL